MGVLVAFVVAAAVVGVFLQVGALTYAYRRIGIGPGWMLVVLVGALVGSTVNVPVARLRPRRSRDGRIPSSGAAIWPIPAQEPADLVVAVNVGGAIVPCGVAGYLVAHDHLGWPVALATAFVAIVVFHFADVVPGQGVVMPALIPAAAAALAATVSAGSGGAGGSAPAAVAFVAGTVGTLVGGDLMNLPRLRSSGGDVMAIGGAGTFDGIFVTGVLAVLIATV